MDRLSKNSGQKSRFLDWKSYQDQFRFLSGAIEDQPPIFKDCPLVKIKHEQLRAVNPHIKIYPI